MVIGRSAVFVLILTLFWPIIPFASSSPAIETITAVTDVSDIDFIVDARPIGSCRKASLPDAVCIPVEDVLAPNRRLANWSGILWLLGTAGLTGDEHVAVTGQRADRRAFMAALLYLAGQRKVSLVETPVSNLLSDSDVVSGGKMRATTRTSVFTARLRSEQIVLVDEAENLIDSDSIFLDGRSEAEYYGGKIRAARGGHLSGASHSPLSDWTSNPDKNSALYGGKDIVAYAHDTYDGLVYLSGLLSAGIQARLYVGGWSEWALDGSLPADSVSYTSNPVAIKTTNNIVSVDPDNSTARGMIVGGLIATVLLTTSFFVVRILSNRAAKWIY